MERWVVCTEVNEPWPPASHGTEGWSQPAALIGCKSCPGGLYCGDTLWCWDLSSTGHCAQRICCTSLTRVMNCSKFATWAVSMCVDMFETHSLQDDRWVLFCYRAVSIDFSHLVHTSRLLLHWLKSPVIGNQSALWNGAHSCICLVGLLHVHKLIRTEELLKQAGTLCTPSRFVVRAG